jgi:hypothetical protein
VARPDPVQRLVAVPLRVLEDVGLVDHQVVVLEPAQELALRRLLLLKVRDRGQDHVQPIRVAVIVVVVVVAVQALLDLPLHSFSLFDRPVELDHVEIGRKGLELPLPVGQHRRRDDHQVRKLRLGLLGNRFLLALQVLEVPEEHDRLHGLAEAL